MKYITANETTIYKVLIAQLMNSANLFLFSAPTQLLKKLTVQQNKGLQIIFFLSNRTDLDDKRMDIKIPLPEHERIIEMLCHSYLVSLKNEYQDLRPIGPWLHVEGRRQLRLPLKQLYKKELLYVQKLPSELHTIPNISEFKTHLQNNPEILGR